MKSILIFLKTGHIFRFKGKYREDLQTNNWHYYEDDLGNILHFPKDNLASVVEGESADKYTPTEFSTILNSQIDHREMN